MKLIKSIPLLALALAVPTPTQARSAYGDNLCRNQERLARTVMAMRQAGKPMSESIDAYGNRPDGAPTRTMISMAYDVPVRLNPLYKQREVIEFGGFIANLCYDAAGR